jgi:hypothetical protein
MFADGVPAPARQIIASETNALQREANKRDEWIIWFVAKRDLNST